MNQRNVRLVALVAACVAALVGYEALAAKGGKPKPPPEPANPAMAFVQDWNSWKGPELVVMDADGGNATVIRKGGHYVKRPSWSPDGKHLAFVDDGDLWRIDVDVVDGVPRGSNDTELFDADDSVSCPQWSPVADEILFNAARFVDGKVVVKLRVIPASGGTPRVVYAPPAGQTAGHPTWSPNGKRIAFVTNDGANGLSFRILDVATGVVTTALSGWQGGCDDLDWARTGNVLAIQAGNETTDGEVHTLDLATGTTTYRFEGSRDLTWAPDDSRLAFVGGTPGGLYTYRFATGAIELLAKKAGRFPDWRR